MKVLFISSANKKEGINTIVKNQGKSLEEKGIKIEYFGVEGSGIKGYIKNISRLRKYLKTHKFDVIHAHYSLSGVVASLAGAKPLVVSLMGSDVVYSRLFTLIARFFSKHIWHTTIVKSAFLKEKIRNQMSIILPNGVDTTLFRPMDKTDCQKRIGWDISKKHIFFPASKDRPEKNYQLARISVEAISEFDIVLHDASGVKNEEMPIYYNAANLVLLTSIWEGSPNAIKEALACNRPIISTKVGDVPWLLSGVKGCYLIENNYSSISKHIYEVLKSDEKCSGNEAISRLELKREQVADKLIELYRNAVSS